MRNAGVVESQIGIKLAGRNLNSLCFADDAILVSGSEEELKSLLESETGDWKSWPEIQHSKTKIAAFGPISSWQIEGGKVEAVTDFPFLGSRITVNSDCSHEIKRHLFLGRKPVTNLDCIKKSRVYFADKGLSSQNYGFSSSHIGTWELDHKEGWVLKNWCSSVVVLEKILESTLRRLLRVPWTARRSNQAIQRKSTLNIHWKEWCWSWNSNTLATWCKGLTHWKRLIAMVNGVRFVISKED